MSWNASPHEADPAVPGDCRKKTRLPSHGTIRLPPVDAHACASRRRRNACGTLRRRWAPQASPIAPNCIQLRVHDTTQLRPIAPRGSAGIPNSRGRLRPLAAPFSIECACAGVCVCASSCRARKVRCTMPHMRTYTARVRTQRTHTHADAAVIVRYVYQTICHASRRRPVGVHICLRVCTRKHSCCVRAPRWSGVRQRPACGRVGAPSVRLEPRAAVALRPAAV